VDASLPNAANHITELAALGAVLASKSSPVSCQTRLVGG
jgi:hypothetical protein